MEKQLKPNLARHHLTNLTVLAAFTKEQGGYEVLDEFTGESTRFLSGTPYSVNKRRHILTVEIVSLELNGHSLRVVRLQFDTGVHIRRWRVPKTENRLELVMRILGELLGQTLTIPLICFATFELPYDLVGRLVPPLPMSFATSGGNESTLKVQGVRGTFNSEGTKGETRVEIDRREASDDATSEDLRLKFQYQIEPTQFSWGFESRAIDIARSLLNEFAEVELG